MRMSEAFPSKYLRASDLQGQRVSVYIDVVKMENVGREDAPDNKPVVYFTGKEKGLVLNKTNNEQIIAMYGDESGGWQGKQIELFVQKVSLGTQMVDGIRILAPANVNMTGQAMPDGRPTMNTPPSRGPSGVPEAPGPVGPLDDSIPDF